MEFTLECQSRSNDSKPNALRRAGRLPAVLYGHQGSESLALTVDAKAAEMLLRNASVNNTLVQLDIPDHSWKGKALIREVQSHPWKHYLYHLSFFAVSAHDSLEVDVPLHFVGEAVGVKHNGGSLDTVLTSLHVKCIADTIPEFIEIDVSGLEVGDALHVNELVLPQGVVPTGEADRVVVSVLQGRGGSGDSGAAEG